jgi:5-methylcytosine-specific restriction protein A
MPLRVSRAALAQRQGRTKRSTVVAIELQAPHGVGGSAPRASTRTTGKRSVNPSTRRWRELRAAKLEADPACELKLPGCEGAAVEVDHIQQLKDGGERFAWENLRSVCEACHMARHGKRRRYGFDLDGNPLDPEHPWNKY